jgi:Bacterial Ig domain/Divergent InlB B-repeat domain
VDPSDDCTFWYAQELYPANGIFNWDTQIASFKFPNCAANDFSLTPGPDTVTVAPGQSNTTTVSTALTKGSAESVDLNTFDVPANTTASFSPTTVTAGSGSTLTFNVGQTTPAGTYTVQLVGTAASALHGATVTVDVTPTHTLTVTKSAAGSGKVTSNPAGIDCGSTCTNQFAVGSPVTLTATPDSGSVFLNWSGDCSGATCVPTMDADRAVTANFDALPRCNNLSGLNAAHDTALQIALGCSDADSGDKITYSIVSGPSHGSLGSIDSTGHLTYTPNAGYVGGDSFSYKATDNHGQDSGTATVTLTVAQVAPPTCSNRTLTTNHNTALALSLSCSHVESTALQYAVVAAPAHGKLSGIDAGGNLTYTPNPGYHGADSFTYKATDSHGQDSNIATVSIAVGSNHPPVCTPQTVPVAYGKSKGIALHCSDLDPGQTLHWAIVGGPAHGKVGAVSGGGTVMYTPRRFFFGTDSFRFTGIDSDGGTSTATTIVLHVANPCAGLRGRALLRCKAKIQRAKALQACARIKNAKKRKNCISAAQAAYRRALKGTTVRRARVARLLAQPPHLASPILPYVVRPRGRP